MTAEALKNLLTGKVAIAWFESCVFLVVVVATVVKSCIVHQIHNSVKYVATKDQKAFIP